MQYIKNFISFKVSDLKYFGNLLAFHTHRLTPSESYVGLKCTYSSIKSPVFFLLIFVLNSYV